MPLLATATLALNPKDPAPHSPSSHWYWWRWLSGDYADATPNAARTANRRHEGRKIGRAARGRHDGAGRTGRSAR